MQRYPEEVERRRANEYERDPGRRTYSSGRYYYEGREYAGDYEQDRGRQERPYDREEEYGGGYGRRAMGGRDYSRTGRAYDRSYEQDVYDRGRFDRDYGRSEHYRRYYPEGDFGGRSEGRAYDHGPEYTRSYYRTRGFDYDQPFERGYRDREERRGESRYYDESEGYGGREERSRGEGERAEERDLSYTYTQPWLVPGPYVGHGPRGYERSKERIFRDICERLSRHGQIDASNIEVRIEGDEVTLEGRVDSRWSKRIAEDVADSVSGVRDVHNRLHVLREEERSAQTG